MNIEKMQINREINQASDFRPLNTIKQIKEVLEDGVVLSEKEAIKLFAGSDGDKLFLVQHINQFKGLDQNSIVLKMLHEGRGQWVWDNFDKFDNLDEDVKELVYKKFNEQDRAA